VDKFVEFLEARSGCLTESFSLSDGRRFLLATRANAIVPGASKL